MTSLEPTAYDWPAIHKIPQREFFSGPAYQKGQVSLTVGPGGLGKSTLCITEAVAMAGGFSVFGNEPLNLKVWYLSAEDDKEEMDRRIAAACEALHADRSTNLHVDCVEKGQIQIANSDGLNTGLIENLIAEIRDKKMKVVFVDPFICTHDVSENDNSKIDKVARAWKRIAREAECAIHIVHHQAKDTKEGSDGARGASALRDAARYIRTLVPVPNDAETLKRLGLQPSGKHVRILVTKSNFHRAIGSHVFTLGTRTLMNGRSEDGEPQAGDRVGAIELYPKHDTVPSTPTKGNRKGQRSAAATPVRPARTTAADEHEVAIILDLAAGENFKPAITDALWLGLAVAEALKLDPKIDKAWLIATFKDFTERGLLVEFNGPSTGNSGNRAKFYKPGDTADRPLN